MAKKSKRDFVPYVVIKDERTQKEWTTQLSPFITGGKMYLMQDKTTWTNNRIKAGKFTQESAALLQMAQKESVPVRIALW